MIQLNDFAMLAVYKNFEIYTVKVHDKLAIKSRGVDFLLQ